jgi:hypothetical protein
VVSVRAWVSGLPVSRFELRQFFGARQDDLPHLAQDATALGRGELAPRAAECAACRGDGAVDVGRIAAGQLIEGNARARVEHGQRFAAGRRDPLAADEMVLHEGFSWWPGT